MIQFIAEFKEFALKGNVMHLAVGVMIGAAFQGVVTSLSENILSPIIGLVGGKNLDTLEVTFWGVTLKYGAFLTSIVNYFILAFIVFLMVRAMNRLRMAGHKPVPDISTTKDCPYCLTAVPLAATRCPACTSQLGDDPAP